MALPPTILKLHIEAMRRSFESSNDKERVAMCTRALSGDKTALFVCEKWNDIDIASPRGSALYRETQQRKH